MITFQHKKEKAFCLKNESIFPGFIQQSGRGEVRRESVSNERTGGRMGRELGLTEMAAPPLSFLLSPAFSDSTGSVWPFKKKELPAEEFTSLATVSDKNSWGKNQTFFFSFSCSPCPSRSCLSRFSHQTVPQHWGDKETQKYLVDWDCSLQAAPPYISTNKKAQINQNVGKIERDSNMEQRIASPWGDDHTAMLGPFYLPFHTY